MEYVSIAMKIGWALWLIANLIVLFLLRTGTPRQEYVKQSSMLYGQAIAQMIASIAFIIILNTQQIADKLVTDTTKWIFVVVPYVCFIRQVTRIPKASQQTVPKR